MKWVVFLLMISLTVSGWAQVEDSTKFIIGISGPLETIELQMTDSTTTCKKGILVPSLYRGLPIHKDGLLPGDVLVSIDGNCVESLADLSTYIGMKKERKITLTAYSYDTLKHIETSLLTMKEFKEIKQEFMNKVDVKDDGTFSVSRDLSDEFIDRGDAYKYFRCEKPFSNTHWDFQHYTSLNSAKKQSSESGKPILLALFGSYNCCSYISLSQDDYQEMIADERVQNLIKEEFVSVLVLKPEAYVTYKDYELEAGWPALLVIDNKGKLQKSLLLTNKVHAKKVATFLQRSVAK